MPNQLPQHVTIIHADAKGCNDVLLVEIMGVVKEEKIFYQTILTHINKAFADNLLDWLPLAFPRREEIRSFLVPAISEHDYFIELLWSIEFVIRRSGKDELRKRLIMSLDTLKSERLEIESAIGKFHEARRAAICPATSATQEPVAATDQLKNHLPQIKEYYCRLTENTQQLDLLRHHCLLYRLIAALLNSRLGFNHPDHISRWSNTDAMPEICDKSALKNLFIARFTISWPYLGRHQGRYCLNLNKDGQHSGINLPRQGGFEPKECQADATRIQPRIISNFKKFRRILAIGDIHGCATLLKKLIEVVQPTCDDLIVTLGDYIDRGEDSSEVIDILLDLHRACNVISLRGNHDAMLLMCFDGCESATVYYPDAAGCDGDIADLQEAVATETPAAMWFENLARKTLESYLCKLSDQKLIAESQKRINEIQQRIDDRFAFHDNYDYRLPLQKLLAKLVPPEHIAFLRHTCVDALETDQFIFAHGGVCPGQPLVDQPLIALHWASPDEITPPHLSGKRLVKGHNIQPDYRPAVRGNTVRLDTGAYVAGPGRLTCMDVISGQYWQADYQKTIQESSKGCKFICSDDFQQVP